MSAQHLAQPLVQPRLDGGLGFPTLLRKELLRFWKVAFQTIAAYYWDETRGDGSLNDAQKKDYVGKGLEAVDKAISMKPDFVEAITFKGLLLRLQANLEKDPAKQQALIKEATGLSDKANELRKAATGRS